MMTKNEIHKVLLKQPQNVAGSSVFGRSDFTGKELDLETGYSYFGARYLDNALSTAWLSVDPMSDKYLSISPYAYCAWNPIRLTDPNGDTIMINGTIYQSGMEYDGENDFTKKTVNALNEIYYKGGDEGAELINTLCSSKHKFDVKERKNGVSEFIPSQNKSVAAYVRSDEYISSNWKYFEEQGWTEGSGGDVMWNSEGYLIFTSKGLRKDPVYQLLHELCHAYDANYGTLNSIEYKGYPDDIGISLSEWSACMRANCIGSYMGYPTQTIYQGSADSSGKYIEGTGTRLFDKNGTPIIPF